MKDTPKVSSQINAKIKDNTLTLKGIAGKSEYAVMLIKKDTRKLVDIIRSDATIPLPEEIIRDDARLVIVDIYTDEEIFSMDIQGNKTHFPETDNIKAAIIPAKEERNTASEISPPKLVTKKRTMNVTDTSFLSLLRPFDSFDCAMPPSDMREYDEKIVKKTDAKVLFEGLSVPARYPYLGYNDFSLKNCSLPRRLIGTALINDRTYLAYGVLADIRRCVQPFFGYTGYVYLAVSGADTGYWMMYLDMESGKISYPYDEELMCAGKAEDYVE